ncbi:DnaA N-terminal domain-containing protein [Sporohalobacter salinus]|uniref:DnaA N-terminal domain-containing protein n=1 Tax=Sporohalobacter salinus TaxID=1494606 RepID=UPI00195F6190|nr:DnaA N-terminal domain-containing protein [Sporohalobacter salinus]MBM7623750.1 DNA polymerase III alpha subunit (gram-positive type) [Sporohalobacter salinus]
MSNKVREIIRKESPSKSNKVNIKELLNKYKSEIDENIKKEWQKLYKLLEEELPASSFNTWFSNLKLVTNIDNKLIFLTANEFQSDQLKNHYSSLLEQAMQELTNKNFKFSFASKSEIVKKIKNQ